MSSDERTADLHASSGEPGGDGTPPVTPRLLDRLRGTGRDRTPEAVMSELEAVLHEADADRESTAVGEEIVTHSLDELLLALIALRDDGTHGTGLMEDMATLFDVKPSPGTVYPRLHDLDEAGVLARHDLVQTKQYAIADGETARSSLEDAMYQHLTLGLFLHSALEAV